MRYLFIILTLTFSFSNAVAKNSDQTSKDGSLKNSFKSMGRAFSDLGISIGKTAKKSGLEVGKIAKEAGIKVGQTAKKAGTDTGDAVKKSAKNVGKDTQSTRASVGEFLSTVFDDVSRVVGGLANSLKGSSKESP
jgi:hypothetical protein